MQKSFICKNCDKEKPVNIRLIVAQHYCGDAPCQRAREAEWQRQKKAEDAMIAKSLIIPELRRVLKPPFAWIDRLFLFNGFLAELSQQENLVYFFLTLVADRDGLSFYSYDKICQLLQLEVEDYIQARNGLIQQQLIAYDDQQFQVLALPGRQRNAAPKLNSKPQRQNQVQSLADIFAQLVQQVQQ